MTARRRTVLGVAVILVVGFGVGFIDAMPTWLVAVIAAVVAVGSIVGWLVMERRLDREAGVR